MNDLKWKQGKYKSEAHAYDDSGTRVGGIYVMVTGRYRAWYGDRLVGTDLLSPQLALGAVQRAFDEDTR